MDCPMKRHGMCEWSGDLGNHSVYYGLHHECPECMAYVDMGVWVKGCVECAALPLQDRGGSGSKVSRPVAAAPIGVEKGPVPRPAARPADYFDGFTRAVFAAIPRVERGLLYAMMTRKQRGWVFGRR